MKLLISLPLSDAAQRFYGSSAPIYNKVGDAGIDLPFISDVKPYDPEVVETIGVISFETVFAMYDLEYKEVPFNLFDFLLESGHGASNNEHRNLSVIVENYQPSKFYIVPRSSISKTPFRLANCEGIIDAGYRGIEYECFANKCPDTYKWVGDTLGCYLDYHPQLGIRGRESHIDAGDRLLQVVAPSLDNILWVRLDFTEENCQFWSEVISNEQRSGFGSTN
jgi:dUTPase